jgi:hypothetical protein
MYGFGGEGIQWEKGDNILKRKNGTVIVGRMDGMKGLTCEGGDVVGQMRRRMAIVACCCNRRRGD